MYLDSLLNGQKSEPWQHVTTWLCLLGVQEKKTKQVVMGKLGLSDSFAEISLLEEEPITCSIVTATDMELGVVRPERLHGKKKLTCF